MENAIWATAEPRTFQFYVPHVRITGASVLWRGMICGVVM